MMTAMTTAEAASVVPGADGGCGDDDGGGSAADDDDDQDARIPQPPEQPTGGSGPDAHTKSGADRERGLEKSLS